MGNIVSYFGNYRNYKTEELSNIQNIDFDEIDSFSKTQLMDYIKDFKTKHLNLDESFFENLKTVELENSDMLPMCLEFYEKCLKISSEFKPPADSTKNSRMYFVRPKFGIDDIKKSIGATSNPVVTTKLNETLMQIPTTVVSMKNDDITLEEYNNSFNNVMMKKDMVGITKKLLRDMPQYLKIRFINCFNQLLSDLSKVNKISIGKGSYIYKTGKHGSTLDINSFRQVVSIPNAVSQFHRILTLRLNTYLQTNKYLDTSIQKGGVSGQRFAIFEQFYKIKNVIKHANKNNKSLAILFLDISNAFGNLNLEALYKILDIYNVDKNFIQYLKEFYSKFEYYIQTLNIKTENFKWGSGLIQGCSLSPLLFILALNYVLTYLDKEFKNQLGYNFDDVNRILLTAFVDDICIICKDMNSLDIVYKKLKDLLGPLGLPINKAKSAIMVVNDKTSVTGELNDINKVNVFKYLGEYISNDGTCIESYIQFLKLVTRKLKMIDVKITLSTDDKIKLFNSFVVPWIQRKTLAMYDISMTNRLKIVSIIKPYLEKWGYKEEINIFSNITPIINSSNDCIISNIKFDTTDFDEELEENIEYATFVLKDSSVKLEYSQIDDDFQLEHILMDNGMEKIDKNSE